MHEAAPHTSFGSLRLRYLSFACVAVGLLVAACTDDAIVYPNRNLRAAGAANVGEAGEAGEPNGGAPAAGGSHGGSGGASGGLLGDAGEESNAGAPPTGPVCGDRKVEGAEECDDGNDISGDGCSWDCKTACETCEQKVCPTFDVSNSPPSTPSAYDDCFRPKEKITSGPAVGVTRGEVCQELVDCIREENCAQTKGPVLRVQRCWCDQDWTPNKQPTTECTTDPDPKNPLDPSKFIPGKCSSLFQDASEASKLSDIPGQLTAIERPLGAAIRLLSNCDTRECTEECVATYFGREGIATISADIVYARNAAGESPLGNLVADSQREIAAADFAMVSARFIFSEIPPDLLFAPTPYRGADAPGRVLWSEALLVNYGHPNIGNFGASPNELAQGILYKVTFSGKQIYDALAQQMAPTAGGILYVSGLTYEYTFDASNPTASIITNVRKISDGSLVDNQQKYTVAVTDYLTSSKGGVPVLMQGIDATPVPTSGLSAILGEYLKGLPQPISPPELNRIKRLN